MEPTAQHQRQSTGQDQASGRAIGRHALGGFLLGLLVALSSILLVLFETGLRVTPANVLVAHRTVPLLYLIDAAPLVLGLLAAIAGRRQDRLRLLNQGLRTETRQLEASQAELDQRLQDLAAELTERTHRLERLTEEARRRRKQLLGILAISRSIATILDPDELIDRLPKLVADHLGYYHVGVFLLDKSTSWAVLRAANSEGGQRMLARGHRLRVGEQGIVGYATRTGRPRLALDVGSDAIHFDNPDLPETRSEIALPLIARYQILGALDVQSREADAFDEQDVAVLKELADQIAVALDNARLFKANQTALKQAEETQRAYLQQGWRRRAAGERGATLFGSHRPSAEHEAALQTAIQQAVDSGSTIVANRTAQDKSVVAPIKIRDQIIGTLGLANTDDSREWSKDQVDLVETVADQVAQALESARLFEEAQRRAEREQVISQVGAKLRSTDDVDGILRVAVQEMRRALGVSHGAIRLGTETHLVPSYDREGGQAK